MSSWMARAGKEVTNGSEPSLQSTSTRCWRPHGTQVRSTPAFSFGNNDKVLNYIRNTFSSQENYLLLPHAEVTTLSILSTSYPATPFSMHIFGLQFCGICGRPFTKMAPVGHVHETQIFFIIETNIYEDNKCRSLSLLYGCLVFYHVEGYLSIRDYL